MTVQRLTGDALETIRSLPTNSVDLIASSPPFLALRNYNDLDGQWGSEPTPADFLDRLLELATASRRVLTPTGSMAIELGDTYSGSGGGGGDYLDGGMREGQNSFNGSAKAANAKHWRDKQASKDAWPLSKSLTGIPTLYAWSLAYGRNLLNPQHQFEPWRIRNVIVWARNNPPVGALGDKVRPATSYITVACPSGKRWFDLDAVRTEPQHGHYGATGTGKDRSGNGFRGVTQGPTSYPRTDHHPAGAPPTDHWIDEYDGDLTWLVNSAGSSLAHYAMWPARLAERLVLSMCPAEVCTVCGEPRRRITGPAEYVKPDGRPHRFQGDDMPSGTLESGKRQRVTGRDNGNYTKVAPTLGWSDCGHGSWRPGHVLDPFSGTGTTLATADIHGRDATGIDLDPDNRDLYERRYNEVWRTLKPDAGTSPVTEHGTQGALPL